MGENMKENILSSAGNQLTEIPREIWEQHVDQTSKDIPKVLGFMTEAHHLIRYFVVRELPRIGKPIAPERISEELDIPLSRTIEILDDLEKNLFFLVRNEQGEISWAFPVTVDKTPHRLTFSTGERLNAA
jgi:hypothetical protein